jgi:hypothetical protein
MILTVQSTGNKTFRLGISLYDSKNTFNSERGVSVHIILNEQNIDLRTTCGPPLNKGFDFYDRLLSNWIIANGYHKYLPRQPKKLFFNYETIGEIHTLTFVGVLER